MTCTLAPQMRLCRRQIKSARSPRCESWNAPAVPENVVVISEGSTRRATRFTSATAPPSEPPGATSNESVTEGSCPE